VSIIKKLAGQTAIYGLSSILGRLLNYALVPLYTGIFHKAEYGVSSAFYAYSSFLAVIFTYGMETAFFRFYQKSEDKERVFSTAMISILTSSVLLGVMIFLFATPLAQWTKNEGRQGYFWYFAIIMAADAISTIPFAWLRQQNEAKRFAKLKLLAIGVNIGLNLFFYWLCPKLLAAGWSDISLIYNREAGITYMFGANVISSLVVLPFFMKEYKLMRFGFDRSLWKQMLVYSFPLIFMGFAGMINETLDRILLKQLIPDQALAEAETGIYAANYKLSILITLFIQAFRFAAEPFFFSRAKEADAKEVYGKVMQYFVLVCATIFLVVLLYLDIFKHFIRSEEYWEGLKVVPILLMANVFLGIYYNLSIWYKLTDKTKLGALVSIVGAVITLVLNWLWIPKYSYMGCAWATLICYFSMALISYLLGKKYYPVPYNLQRIGTYLALAVSFYAISDLIRDILPTDISYFFVFLINTLLLATYLFILANLERRAVGAFLKSRKKSVPVSSSTEPNVVAKPVTATVTVLPDIPNVEPISDFEAQIPHTHPADSQPAQSDILAATELSDEAEITNEHNTTTNDLANHRTLESIIKEEKPNTPTSDDIELSEPPQEEPKPNMELLTPPQEASKPNMELLKIQPPLGNTLVKPTLRQLENARNEQERQNDSKSEIVKQIEPKKGLPDGKENFEI
jgi:O-antigen/teichoic acid export membrane protein